MDLFCSELGDSNALYLFHHLVRCLYLSIYLSINLSILSSREAHHAWNNVSHTVFLCYEYDIDCQTKSCNVLVFILIADSVLYFKRYNDIETPRFIILIYLFHSAATHYSSLIVWNNSQWVSQCWYFLYLWYRICKSAEPHSPSCQLYTILWIFG